jgi:hypothetical protein
MSWIHVHLVAPTAGLHFGVGLLNCLFEFQCQAPIVGAFYFGIDFVCSHSKGMPLVEFFASLDFIGFTPRSEPQTQPASL